MEELLNKAIRLAKEYHKVQMDKGGEPYIGHPLRVMEGVETLEEKILAVLHDVLEDCDVTADQLIEEGIPKGLVEKLIILCKGKNEEYFHYINRIKNDKATINVKLSDLKDNMDLTRLKETTEKDIERLKKYKKAKEILESVK